MIRVLLKNIIILTVIFNMTVPVQAYELLSDDLPLEYVNSVSTKKVEYKPFVYEDEAVKILSPASPQKHKYIHINYIDKAFSENVKYPYKKIEYVKRNYPETYIPKTDMLTEFERPVYTGELDLDPGIPVKIKPVKSYKTKLSTFVMEDEYDPVRKRYNTVMVGADPKIGTRIEFKTVEDVYADSKLIIPKGQKVIANITMSAPGIGGGSGGEIEASRFRVISEDGQIIRLNGEIYNMGADLGLFLYLIALAGAPFSFGTSYLLLSAPGMAGVISSDKVYTVYYKPNK